MKITNINRDRPVDFTITVGGGKPPKVESLRAGESRNIDISPDDVQVKVLKQTGQIVTGAEATKAAAQVKPQPTVS